MEPLIIVSLMVAIGILIILYNSYSKLKIENKDLSEELQACKKKLKDRG